MSLHEKSILIDITLHSFSATKTDNNVTGEVLFNKSAMSDAGRWITRLLPKEATHPIAQLDGQIRKHHRQQTLPWSNDGARILPSANFDNYMEQHRSFRRQREELVEAFRRTYPTYLHSAARANGALFNPADYPSAEQAAALYDFEIKATPVPHENDFRCQLNSAADMAAIQADLKKQVKAAEQNAVIDLFQRIAEPLARMAERLADPNAKFRNTLVSNIEEIAALIPVLNITGDPRLTQIHDSIRNQLSHYTADALRNSPSDRRAAAAKAQSIFNQAAAWMNKPQSQAA